MIAPTGRTFARRRARGYTLLELMVAGTVAIISIAMVMSVFIAINQSVFTQEASRAGQASLRNAVQLLTPKLRMAGYGIEPSLAFAFPADWRDDATRNNSDRIVFRMRDPRFGRAVTSSSATSIELAAEPGIALPAGTIIQIVCPGATAWAYGQLSAANDGNSTTLSLEADTGAFPRTNDLFTAPCFDQLGSGPSPYLFKIDEHSFRVELLDEDGVSTTPPRPYLFSQDMLSTSATLLGEPVMDDIEAMRVAFLRDDGTEFVPDPTAAAPTYETRRNDPLRDNDNPANIRAVRIGLVGRSATRDPVSAEASRDDEIPAFGGRAVLTAPAGYERVLLEFTVPVPNLGSTEMFLPPFTQDVGTNVCQGAAPSDGFNCISG